MKIELVICSLGIALVVLTRSNAVASTDANGTLLYTDEGKRPASEHSKEITRCIYSDIGWRYLKQRLLVWRVHRQDGDERSLHRDRHNLLVIDC